VNSTNEANRNVSGKTERDFELTYVIVGYWRLLETATNYTERGSDVKINSVRKRKLCNV